MADNLFPEATVTPSSSKLAFAETTFGGDAVFVGASFLGIIAGPEGTRTFTPIVAGAGVVDGGTPRFTLASDDPLVVSAASIDTKTPALGQALAATSVPVVLTAAQLTTLTPPAAITGFATAANQTTEIAGLASIDGHVDGIEALLTAIAAGQLPDSHNVTVDNASIAVTGTFWQATQPVSGTFWQATQPVSGTVTANLAAGTSNIGDVDVLSLPAIPAGTNNIGDVDILTIAAGDNNIGNVDIVTVPADPFGVNADAASATGSISAKLRFIASTGIPITGTVTVGAHAVTNAGVFVTQENGAALTALQKIDDPVIVDDAAFTPATSSVMMAGFEADETATDSVDEGDGGAARMTLDRKQIVTVQPHTAGGLTVFRSLDLDETEEEVKATAGCLYKLRITNFATSIRYVKLYNATAANVSVGSTTPIDTIPIPPAAASGATVLTESYGGVGLTFDTALSIAATTALADADTGAPAANDVVCSAYFK